MKTRFKDSKKQLNELLEQQKNRRQQIAKLAIRKPVQTKPVKKATSPPSLESTVIQSVTEPPIIKPRSREALIPLFKDDSIQTSAPSSALIALADLYLHAAQYRSRHIAMVWPASLKTLTLVHVLATLARWNEGDKQGIRGSLFPVKTNAFYRLNHLHFDRSSLLQMAKELAEVNDNAKVTRSMPEKDAFLFSLTDSNLSLVSQEPFHPTIGELLPLFIASPDSVSWKTCDSKLLALTRAKLARRHAKALKTNCSVIGDPKTAPDALFSLDGRMSENELRQACKSLVKVGPPEVVLVQATRNIRMEASGWRGRLARFCLMLEEVFGDLAPGVVVVTDEPHAVYQLKNELWKKNKKRHPNHRWFTPHEFRVVGMPSTGGSEGLLPPGVIETKHPVPREFDVSIVDADVAKIANKLARIANAVPSGSNAAKSLIDMASFLSRLAALPCGVRHMSEYLTKPDVSDCTRRSFDWHYHVGVVREFDRDIGIGDNRSVLMDCINRGSKLFENYFAATPFAHKLAELIINVALSKSYITIVFTNALYRHLAHRFLTEYDQYPSGLAFEDFHERVHLISATQLEEHFDRWQGSKLVFAGLNEECLRQLITDDRVPAHSVLLLTQRAGQFLRATLSSIVEHMSEFKSYKPRMESILRQLKDLPEDSSVLSKGDYILPTFRVELSSEISLSEHDISPNSWIIRLDNGITHYRRDTFEMYVYDPASQHATDARFRTCQVRSLEIGYKVFVMSTELREMVEQVLSDAGVPIQSDKTFEAALRSYHEQVTKRLAKRFSQHTAGDMVRVIREEMLTLDPSIEGRLPDLQAMRYWIDLDHSRSTRFEDLKPQAPRDEAVFRVFAQTLGFSTLEIEFQWQRVITAVRNSRRLDGRHISDIYAYMLLQPESVMAHSSIKRQTLNQLFDSARECIATVEYISPPKESLL